MAGPTGHGSSLGAALNDLLRSQVTARHRLSSYNARHWHAQLSQLTATHRGYQALEDAGLNVTTKTLINWLSDPEYNIRRSYRGLIPIGRISSSTRRLCSRALSQTYASRDTDAAALKPAVRVTGSMGPPLFRAARSVRRSPP
jgi:hypothetical protein